MLAEFRVGNYRSFKDEQVLSLIASADESKGKNSIEVGGHRILKTAVVYGANASGKSNLIKAMACMGEIVKNSAAYKPGEKLPVTPFMFDEKTPKQSTTFEVTFFIDGVRYQYGFSTTKNTIVREYLLAWPSKREQTWFEREYGTNPYFGPSLKGQNKSTWSKVKDNSLFLSVASQWNHEQLSNVYNWFDKYFNEFPTLPDATRKTDEFLFFDSQRKNGTPFREIIINTLKNADFGIENLEIELVNVEGIEFTNNIPPELKDMFLVLSAEQYPFAKKFYHCNGKYFLEFNQESDGTQKFYSLIGPLLESIVSGFTIFKDELEHSLHPLLTRSIINLVRDNKLDNTCAQLIFTTHDTTLLDPELFGRDQVWFTEKGKDGGTELYSLADFKGKTVREGEAMQKSYLAGKYGAIPVLERFDLIGNKKE